MMASRLPLHRRDCGGSIFETTMSFSLRQQLDARFQGVMPAVVKVMNMDSTLITLIKPQFEARRSQISCYMHNNSDEQIHFDPVQVGGGGIVRDPLVHKEVLDRIISGVEQFGFCNKGWIESPIKGAEGNTEFLACFHRIPVPVSQTEAT